MATDDLFDREIKALFEQSNEVLSRRYGAAMQVGKINELTCLNRYQTFYKAMKDELGTSDEFHEEFKHLYKKKKTAILKSLEDDKWLKNGDIEIQFGESQGLAKKCKNMKLMLSNIYNCAVDLQAKSYELLGDLTPDIIAGSDNKDLIRPSILLLHLLRLFYAVGEENDKLQLSSIIESLESDLSVKNRVIKPLIAASQTTEGLPPSVGSGLSAVFNMVTDVFKKVGVDVPEEVKAPTDEQFNDMIGTFMNTPGIQNAFQGLVAAMAKGDFNQFAKNAFEGLQNPETLQTMQNAVLQTAEIAKSNAMNQQ